MNKDSEGTNFDKCPHKTIFNNQIDFIKKITNIKLDTIHEKVITILEHAEKTNGRVTRLEKAAWGIGGAVGLVGLDKLISVLSSLVIRQPLV